MQLINGRRWAECKEGLHQSSFWVLRKNTCAATTDVPLNCWLDKLISYKCCVPSFSYLYISCGPTGVSTKQMRTTSTQNTLARVRPNRRTDWASPRRNKVDLAASPLGCGSLPRSGLLGCPVKCSAAVLVPQEKCCAVAIIGFGSLSRLIGCLCEVKQVVC